MPRPVEIFFSYAHDDQEHVHALRRQLVLFEKEKVITNWYDRLIPPGEEWKGQIDEHLERADIILLLVSPHFFESNYCYDVEMAAALKRHASNAARAIPVVLEPCGWKSAPFAAIQVLPRDGTPITKWSNEQEAYWNVAEGIMAVARGLSSTGSGSRESASDDQKPASDQLSSGPPSAAADPNVLDVRCSSALCESPHVDVSDSAEISALTATGDGWLAGGHIRIDYQANGHCRTCGRLFEVARRSIPVQFPDLTCEGCGQQAFLQYNVRSLKKVSTGYEFEVRIQCSVCHGQRTVSRLLLSLLRTVSIELGLTGMRVDMQTR